MIDMLSRLRRLPLRPRELFGESCVQSTQFPRRVNMSCEVSFFPRWSDCSVLCYVLQTLENGQLELSTVFLVVQGMITLWPQIIPYNGAAGQHQKFQHVEGESVILCFCLLHVVSNFVKWCGFRDKHLSLKLLEIVQSGGPEVSWSVQDVNGTKAWPRIFLVWADVRFSATIVKAGKEANWPTLRIRLGNIAIFCFCCDRVIECSRFHAKDPMSWQSVKDRQVQTDKGRNTGKRTKAGVVAKAVMGETFNPLINQAPRYLLYVMRELLKHLSFKSDLVVGSARFDYRVFFICLNLK